MLSLEPSASAKAKDDHAHLIRDASSKDDTAPTPSLCWVGVDDAIHTTQRLGAPTEAQSELDCERIYLADVHWRKRTPLPPSRKPEPASYWDFGPIPNNDEYECPECGGHHLEGLCLDRTQEQRDESEAEFRREKNKKKITLSTTEAELEAIREYSELFREQKISALRASLEEEDQE